MIGLDFPVKPEWIHAVLRLWQPQQPVSVLVRAAMSQAMPDVAGAKSRRNSLVIILRNFVLSPGGGSQRQTGDFNPWAVYAQRFSALDLAPVYLAQLLLAHEVAREALPLLAQSPGEVCRSEALRRRLIARFGERKVVTNSASALMRTLQYFGVLQAGARPGEYLFLRRLPAAHPVFPLLVWAVWQFHPAPQIDLEQFAAHPALALLATDGFQAEWEAHQPAYWSLSARLDTRFATLKAADALDWARLL